MMRIFEEGLVQLFILVLNMSLTGCVVILAVLLARLALRKAPRIFSYALWAVVLFRLLCPVSFSLPVSLLGMLQNEPANEGRMEYITGDVGYMEKPEIEFPAPGIGEAVNEILPSGSPAASANPLQTCLAIGAYVWLLGILSLCIYSILSLRKFKKSLKDAVYEKENIYRFSRNGSPFVYGLFRPRIYLPQTIQEEEEQYILLHEQIHIKRGDAAFRLLAYLALWLHWFNPFVWAAFVLSGRDMEMACDEAVIRRLGNKVKKEYSASLLNAASGRQIFKGIPLAFGESDTESRIRNVLRYKKPAALFAGGIAVVSIILAVLFLANPAKEKENSNIFYGVVTEVTKEDGSQTTMVRIPGSGDVALPDAEDISLYLERDAEQIILPGDLVRITYSADQDISSSFSEKAESIQVMGEGFSIDMQENDHYLFTVPLGMAREAQPGDTLEIYHDPKADTTEEVYLSIQERQPGQALLASTEVLSVDAGQYDIWVELTEEEVEIFLSEFGFGITCELLRTPAPADTPLESADVERAYTDILSEDTGSELFSLSPARLREQELIDGMYVVYVRSISRSARGFDLYVTDGEDEEGELPLFPFARDCVFRVNREMDKLFYEEVDFDEFADLVSDAVIVINPKVYCEVEDNVIIRADLDSACYLNGISYAEPVRNTWELFAENAENDLHVTYEELMENYYTPAGTKNADIGDGAGEERIEIYTGNTGDGESGVVIFKDAAGNRLGAEWAHVSRAGWNNIYIGEAEGTGYILTVHIEDRDEYGNYGYQVYRLGEAGEILQIAGSSFDFGGLHEYDDELFRTWADHLSYYLKNSYLVLSSQEGEIRTERISEADKYNYETLKRE